MIARLEDGAGLTVTGEWKGPDVSFRLAALRRNEPRVGGEVFGQHLDRDRAIESRVARPIDFAHSAGPERRDDLVRDRGERRAVAASRWDYTVRPQDTGVSRIRWRRPPQDGRGTCGKEAHGSSTTDDEETETNQAGEGEEQGVEEGRVEKGEVERAGSPEARSQEISFSKSGGRGAGSDRSDVRSASSAGSNAPPVLGSNRRVCRLYRRREGAYQAARSTGDDSRPGAQNLVESPAGTRIGATPGNSRFMVQGELPPANRTITVSCRSFPTRQRG